MSGIRQGFIAGLLERLDLRFPVLFGIFAGLTLFDVVVPDCIPFVDEIGLALITLMLGMWRRRGIPPPSPD